MVAWIRLGAALCSCIPSLIVFSLTIVVASANASISNESRIDTPLEVNVRLKVLGSTVISGQEYLHVGLALQNRTKWLVHYTYYLDRVDSLRCFSRDTGELIYDPKGIMYPKIVRYSNRGMLTPLADRYGNDESIEPDSLRYLGLIGPLSLISGCALIVEVEYVSLDNQSYVSSNDIDGNVKVSLNFNWER